jgi:hypothetical protein
MTANPLDTQSYYIMLEGDGEAVALSVMWQQQVARLEVIGFCRMPEMDPHARHKIFRPAQPDTQMSTALERCPTKYWGFC